MTKPSRTLETGGCEECHDTGYVVQGNVSIPCLECAPRRTAALVQSYLAESRIPKRARSWQFVGAQMVEHWANVDGPCSFFLHGGNGSGKTGAAICALLHWIERLILCRYWFETDLLDAINPAHDSTRSGPSAFETLQDVLSVPVLMLDDIGCRKASTWSQQELSRIVDHRLGAELPIVFTSNFRISDLAEQVSIRCATRIAELVGSRVLQMGN